MSAGPSRAANTRLWASLAVAASGATWGGFWVPLRWLESQGLGGAWVSVVFCAVAAVMPLPLMLRKPAWRGFSSQLVTGTLLSYVRTPLTLRPDDLFSTRDYEVRLTARVIATEQPGGRVRFDREFVARLPVRSAADLGSAERQAAPLIADDLARQVTSALVDGSW